MGKPTICIGKNKGADQLRGNREADQRLCFRYSDSTIPPPLNSKISGFQPPSVLAQPDLCQTCSETTLLVFLRGGSFLDKSQFEPECHYTCQRSKKPKEYVCHLKGLLLKELKLNHCLYS